MTITITSSAFENGKPIPKKYTADGSDVSPPLRWSGVPQGAKQLALICDDPDAPTPQPWVHWVLFNIPPGETALPEAIPNADRPQRPAGSRQGVNSFSNTPQIGYRGPAPPKGHGTHHYHFKLYALDADLDLDVGATKQDLEKALQGHILAQGELVGTYQR